MLSSKTLIWISFIAVVLCAGSGCSKKPEDSPKESPASAAQTSEPLSGPVFVEFIYEIAAEPFQSASFLPDSTRPDSLNGYILDEIQALPVLYPATGDKQPLEGQVLTGYRITNRLDAHFAPSQFLHVLSGAAPGFHTAETAGPSALFERLDLWSLFVRPLRVEITEAAPKKVRLHIEATDFDLTPGSSAALWTDEQEYTLSGLIEDYAERRKTFGAPPLSPAALEEIRADLSAFFPDQKPARFHLRLSARFHGPVKISGFDALAEWRESAANLDAGSYPKALDNLERVLLAAPGHPEALARWGKINQIIKSEKESASLSGRLIFPSGFPTEAEKALWEKYYEGLVTLALPESDPDASLASEPVKNGVFKISAPSGAYRLRVLVPGFAPFEKTVNLSGDTEVAVMLQAAPAS